MCCTRNADSSRDLAYPYTAKMSKNSANVSVRQLSDKLFNMQFGKKTFSQDKLLTNRVDYNHCLPVSNLYERSHTSNG